MIQLNQNETKVHVYHMASILLIKVIGYLLGLSIKICTTREIFRLLYLTTFVGLVLIEQTFRYLCLSAFRDKKKKQILMRLGLMWESNFKLVLTRKILIEEKYHLTDNISTKMSVSLFIIKY